MYCYSYIFLNYLLEIFFTDLTSDLDFDKYAYLDVYFYLYRFYFYLTKKYIHIYNIALTLALTLK